MGGGILELVSSGPQDKFLFENEPKTSPFNITYKKPGNFAIDTKKVYFDGLTPSQVYHGINDRIRANTRKKIAVLFLLFASSFSASVNSLLSILFTLL